MEVRNDLNAAEWELLKGVVANTIVDLRTHDPALDNTAAGASWNSDRSIRAEFLANLLTEEKPIGTGRPRSVKLRGARITGTLDLEARKLLCPVLLQDCHFDEVINLDEAEAFSIRLPGCHIPGFTGVQLRTVGNLEFRAGFAAYGEIRLLGAHIGGQLNLNEAKLASKKGIALNADQITIDQSMLCRDGFAAQGEIRIIGGRIGGQLNFIGAKLTNEKGIALNAYNLTVDQSMLCRSKVATQGGTEFTVQGELYLAGAHIGGELDLSGAQLTNTKGRALSADHLTVDGYAFFRNGFSAQGGVDLTNANVGTFYNDSDGWPNKIRIGGFSYDRIGNQNVGTRDRLQWLRKHDGPFTPQIYDQLAAAYRRAGDERAARKVSVTKQRRRRKPYNPFNRLWFITVGYGYRTWLAFVWAAVLVLAGWLVFSGTFFPVHMVHAGSHAKSSLPPPRFQPLIFTLDVMLPIGGGLGQKSAWQPTGGLLDFYWGLAIAGWVLSTVTIAGLSGILKRD